jgi:hypothetical protein
MQWRGAHIATNQSATATPTGTGTWYPDTTPQNPYLGTFSWRDSGKHTTRHSFATTVDWKPARYDRLSFGFQYGMLKENFATRSQTFTINRVFPGNWGPTIPGAWFRRFLPPAPRPTRGRSRSRIAAAFVRDARFRLRYAGCTTVPCGRATREFPTATRVSTIRTSIWVPTTV